MYMPAASDNTSIKILYKKLPTVAFLGQLQFLFTISLLGAGEA